MSKLFTSGLLIILLTAILLITCSRKPLKDASSGGTAEAPSSETAEAPPSGEEGKTDTIVTATKEQVASWLRESFTGYFQKYNLSCEAAIIRMTVAALGINDLGEDEIVGLMPRHPVDPNLGFVVEDINGSIDNPDGSINWSNYGAHAPVVASVIDRILEENELSDQYKTEIRRLPDTELRDFIRDDPNCLGAIIWVAAFVEGSRKPEKNDLGQVYGEHVQLVSPVLDDTGRIIVYDVWPWPDQPFHIRHPFNRAMFDYETILIMSRGE